MLSLYLNTPMILIFPPIQHAKNTNILFYLQNFLLRREGAFLRMDFVSFILPGDTLIMLHGVAGARTVMFPILDALIKWLLYGFVDLAIPEPHLIDFLLKMAIRFDHIGQLQSKILDFLMEGETLVVTLHLFLELYTKILYLFLQL